MSSGGFRKLRVYILAHELAIQIHKMTLTLPKFELYEEGGQIRRSSKSISVNIVEGYALRKYKSEYLHYLYRSYGSAEETIEHLYLLWETNSLTDEILYHQLLNNTKELCRYLFNFIQAVEQKHRPGFSNTSTP